MAMMQADERTGLKAQIQGDVLTPADDGKYEAARKIWNGMFDRKPALIVQCKSAADVSVAVRFARDHKLLLSVKGGGHHLAGTSVNDGGMVIDLSGMRGVAVDPKAQTAQVEGGALLSDLDSATQQHGLAVPGGIISHTGVTGLTLGGGFGWISRKYGLSIDNLRSAELVTADGSIVSANEKENADLFWGIRGGGGNFGVATALEFSCAPLGTEVFSGAIIKKFDDLQKLMRCYRDYVRTLPDELTMWMVIRKAPPLPFLPPEWHGKLVAIVAVVYLGDPAQAENLLTPIRELGETVGEHLGMTPWVGWQSGFDGLVPHGARNYWKSHDMTALPDAVIDSISEYLSRMPSDDSQVVIVHMEGATSRVPESATAYPHRKVPFMINVETRWHDAADDERCMAWTREFDSRLRDYAQGVYVNFLSAEGEDRVKEAYSPEAWKRLVELKKTWDPMNLFRMNQNIKPV